MCASTAWLVVQVSIHTLPVRSYLTFLSTQNFPFGDTKSVYFAALVRGLNRVVKHMR